LEKLFLSRVFCADPESRNGNGVTGFSNNPSPLLDINGNILAYCFSGGAWIAARDSCHVPDLVNMVANRTSRTPAHTFTAAAAPFRA